MKKTFLFLLLVSTAFISQAQNFGYSKGDNLLHIGLGVNSFYNGGIPFGASYEKGITNDISVGANADYLSNNYNYGSGISYKFTAIYVGARASYHFNKLLKINTEKIDIYGGATIGYRSFKWKDNFSNSGLDDSYDSGVYLGVYAGGKYYFSKKIGVFTEVGDIGSTNARIGLAFKL